MSPEQARGKFVDKRTDIWAFGCVLYEMLSGQATFPGDTLSDTIAAILERDPDWSKLPADVPGALRGLVQRCLAKDAKQRVRDIGDARIELDRIARAPMDEVTASPKRGRLGVLVASAIGLAALASAGALWLTSSENAPAGRSPRVALRGGPSGGTGNDTDVQLERRLFSGRVAPGAHTTTRTSLDPALGQSREHGARGDQGAWFSGGTAVLSG
jgi:serine/threonine protein kinase